MTFLLVLGLGGACLFLWQELRQLRDRVEELEHAAVWGQAAMPEPIVEPEPVRATAQVAMRSALEPQRRPEPIVEAPVPEPEWTSPAAEFAAEEVLSARPAFSFEEMFGRKLPIWAGGATLAVAGFFIVKYSIDAGLLSPMIRVALGFLFGLGLIAGAEAAYRFEDRVQDSRVRQALAGAGIATLYASILVAANLYGLIGGTAAFAGLALVTLAAGFLSLRFGPASAVLGLIGGLSAPALVGAGPPNMPLLSVYLALAVGGLCALGRSQRWWWLGLAALLGGFGWGLTLIIAGVLDTTASLSLGIYTLLLGIAFPLLLTAGPTRALRWGGALAGCAQMAAITATGGFTPLNWALYGLISAAAVWLSRRDTRLADLPLPALAVALMLAMAWPNAPAGLLAIVLIGIALIFGVPTLLRLWREDWRIGDAVQIAAIGFAIPIIPMMQVTDSSTASFAPLAFLGAGVTGAAAAMGWRKSRDDARFVLLVTSCAALLALTVALALPGWMLAPAIAVLAGALLLLSVRAADGRVERVSCAFGAAALAFMLLTGAGLDEVNRAIGLSRAGPEWIGALRWAITFPVAVLFALRARPQVRIVGQVWAVLLGYAAVAQVVAAAWLALVPAVAVPALARARNQRPIEPALATAALLALGWAALPFAHWAGMGIAAIGGYPAFAGNLPSWSTALIRVTAPAVAIVAATMLYPLRPWFRRAAILVAATLGTATLHILYKQIFAIGDHGAFVAQGMAERTVWEILLAGAALLALRLGRRQAAAVAGGLALAHFGWFTLLVHNPLWADQAVGPWLVPAYGTAATLLWAAGRLELSSGAARARDGALMLLTLVFGLSVLRQLVHGPMLNVAGVPQAEDIARSVLAISAAVGFLIWGIRNSRRDWRIASLVLMLGAVAKVFLLDAAGLDGLLRIASFAALGFSLIGVGWLYSRYLPEAGTTT